MTAQEFFKNDLFATNAGVELIEIREGYSKAKLEIKPEHLNAGQRTQGGAIFTLADLALAAAANSHGTLAFSLSSNITFLRASGPGDTLYAEARERYTGRSTGYYQIDVTDQEGRLIATLSRAYSAKKTKFRSLCDNRSLRMSVTTDTLQECLGRTKVKVHIQTYRKVIPVVRHIERYDLFLLSLFIIFHE